MGAAGSIIGLRGNMNKEDNSIAVLDKENIKDKIYTIRGVQVMLDRDLAELYEVKAIRLREQVKRNIKRFPDDFMFQLTDKEVDFMVSHFAIPSKKHLGGTLPYVFTEQGVANISSVLTNDKAIEINIKIMRAFVEMRRFLLTNAQIFQRLDKVEYKQIEYDKKFEKVFEALEQNEIKPKQGIFFDGQIFDAYKFVVDLIKQAKDSIVIIDNYIDDTVFTILTKRKPNVKVLILTDTISDQLELDLKKHNEQYPKIEIKKFKKSHDRFIIIDDKEVYHIGASLKDLGKKWFAFSKMEKESFKIVEEINKV